MPIVPLAASPMFSVNAGCDTVTSCEAGPTLVVALEKAGVERVSVVVPLLSGTKVKPVPLVLLVELVPIGIKPVAVAVSLPPLSNSPTLGVPLVTVTINAPVVGLTGSPKRSAPPPYSAPTTALKALVPANVFVLVGGPDSDIAEDTTATDEVPVVYVGVVAVKITAPVDPKPACT